MMSDGGAPSPVGRGCAATVISVAINDARAVSDALAIRDGFVVEFAQEIPRARSRRADATGSPAG
jgi:hypothetical protein